MLLGILITAIYLLCVLIAPLTGSAEEAGAAVMEGAQAAVPFVLEIAGGICLWSGVLELLERSGVPVILFVNKMDRFTGEKKELTAALGILSERIADFTGGIS